MTLSRKPVETIRSFLEQALVSVGTPLLQAQRVADVLLEADMCGMYSHGMARLARYLKAIESGEVDVFAQPELMRQQGAVARVDAHHGFGQVAGVFAMDTATALAKEYGLGMVTVCHSSHFGIAGYYASRAAPDMIGIAMTNTSPLMVPTGGKKSVLGTNPIAVCVPHEAEPWLMDFSTSAVSRGKIEVCDREGTALEPGWAVDGNGEPCLNPRQVLDILAKRLDGGIAPMAGYKGYGLSALVDIFCGVLSGSGFGLDVGKAGPGNVGHCFLAIDIGRFMPRDLFASRMQSFCTSLTQSSAPNKRVYLHGELESMARVESVKQGIVVAPETDALMRLIAQERKLTW
ncbi:Ldh family oxidoreductase [Candidatus Uhrbacteria bacterium]|nr:Ldh family oxidoreductase [Candidatus Uhrbacteria bacterium]